MSERPVGSTNTVASTSSGLSSTSADLSLSYAGCPITPALDHWVLTRAGKRALHPGGIALSTAMLGHTRLAGTDVVELVPGLGRIAAEIVKVDPASYIATDRDPDAARRIAAVAGDLGTVRQGEAANTDLDKASTNVVADEAIFTIQGNKGKAAIVVETTRVLHPGGRYAIHELDVTLDDIDEDYYTQLRRNLARSIHINAHPMTAAAWKEFMGDVELIVDWVDTTPMTLLKVGHNTRDEGLGGSLRAARNATADKALRRCVQEMVATFKRYKKDIVDIAPVTYKPAS